MLRRSLRAVLTVVAAVTATTTAACTSAPEPPDPSPTRSIVSTTPSKTGSGETRHDLAPLVSRFSALNDPVSATWQSGTLSGSAPGPTTYWIDAVIRLAPATATSLRPLATVGAAQPPQVVEALRADLPTDLRTGPALDAAFAQGGFRATAYLSTGSDVIVLVALGQ